MSDFEKQPNIRLEEFAKADYASEEEVKEFLKNYEELSKSDKIPEEFIERAEACKKILKEINK